MGDDKFDVYISKTTDTGCVRSRCEATISASEDGKRLKLHYVTGRPNEEEILMDSLKPVGPMPTSTTAKALHIDCIPGKEHNILILKVDCSDNATLCKVRDFFVKHIGEQPKKKRTAFSHTSKITGIQSPSSKLAKERENSRPGSRVGQPPHSYVSGTLSSNFTPQVQKRQPRIHTTLHDMVSTETSAVLHIKPAVNESHKGRKRAMSESTQHVIEETMQPIMMSDCKKSKTSTGEQPETTHLPGPSNFSETAADQMHDVEVIEALSQLGSQPIVYENEETNDWIHPFSYRAMRNLGNSCYMNASLQALASSPNFIRNLLAAVPVLQEQREYAIPKRADVLNAVADVYRHIFSSRDNSPERGNKRPSVLHGNREQIPIRLLRNVRETAGTCLDAEFATTSQQDAHEFVSTFLDLMKEDIGQKRANTKSTNSPCSSSTASDKENGPDAEITPTEELDKVPETKIEEDFLELGNFERKTYAGRQVRSKNPSEEFKIDCIATIGCDRCGWASKKVDTALDLQVAIKDGDVSIKTLIDSQLEREEIELKCESCGTLGPGFISTAFQQLPETLIVVVKRYQYTQYGEAIKFEKNVTVDRELFLKDICEGSEAKTRETIARGLSRNEESISGEMSMLSDGHVADAVAKTHILPVKHVLGIPNSPKKGLITTSPRKGRRLSMSQQSEDVLDTQDSNVSDSQEGNHVETIEEDVSFEIEGESRINGSTTPLPTIEERARSPGDLFEDKEDSEVPQTGGGEAPEISEFDIAANKASESHRSLADEGDSHQEMAVAPTQFDSEESITITEEKRADVNSVKWLPLTVKHLIKLQELLEIEEFGLDRVKAWRESFLYTGKNCLVPSTNTLATIESDSDGNCLFRCAAWFVLNGNQMHHDCLRERVCRFMETFKEHFAPLLVNDLTIEEHIMTMKEEGSWGTQVELSAMATLFECCIFSHFQGRWTKFKPLFHFKHCTLGGYTYLSREVDVDKILEMNGAIYISNPDNIHFSIVHAPDISLATTNDYPLTVIQNAGEFDADLDAFKPQTPDLLDYELGCSKNNIILFSDPEPVKEKETYVYRDEDEPVYTLTAVVNHSGSSLRYGHYTSYVFDSERNVWLNCNDSVITKVEESEVLRDSSSTGYMFLYRRRHLNDAAEFKQSYFEFTKSQ